MRVVVSDMKRLSLGFLCRCRRRIGDQSGASTRGGELELEGGTYAGLAFDVNLAGMLLHDAVADGEAQACAFVLALLRLGLGGKERVVDAMEMLALDAGA